MVSQEDQEARDVEQAASALLTETSTRQSLQPAEIMADQPAERVDESADDASSDGSENDPMAALLGKLESSENAFNNKRKSTEPGDGLAGQPAKRAKALDMPPVPEIDAAPAAVAKVQSSKDWSKELPASIWKHVFTFLDPRMLGRLLSVNSSFRGYLDPAYSPPSEVPSLLTSSTSDPSGSSSNFASSLKLMKPDPIWQVSRRAFWPRMPAPMEGKTELDMWRLCRTRSCQFCGEMSGDNVGDNDATSADSLIPGLATSAAVDPWEQGPGAKGVLPVFPFFTVCCGECLQEKSIKVSRESIVKLSEVSVRKLIVFLGNRCFPVVFNAINSCPRSTCGLFVFEAQCHPSSDIRVRDKAHQYSGNKSVLDRSDQTA